MLYVKIKHTSSVYLRKKKEEKKSACDSRRAHRLDLLTFLLKLIVDVCLFLTYNIPTGSDWPTGN